LEHKTFKIEKSKVKITYCHPGVFVPVYYTDAPQYSFKTASGSSIAYWDGKAYASEWPKAGNEGTVPLEEEIEKFYNDIKGAVTAQAAGATISQEAMLVSAPEYPSDTAKREHPTADQQQQKKKRKVEVPSVKKPTAQIEKWASKRGELRGQHTATTSDGAVVELSEFADTVQMCCLLCKRKFQSLEEIQKHEKLSNLHKALPPPTLGASFR
jgi:RNA-binding protein 5/10